MSEAKVGARGAHQVLSLRSRLEEGPTDGGVQRGALQLEELDHVFGAPWRTVELVRYPANSATEGRELDNSDLLLFVVAGQGEARCTSGPVELSPGTSIAILKGERYSLVAGPNADLEVFMAEMKVPEA